MVYTRITSHRIAPQTEGLSLNAEARRGHGVVSEGETSVERYGNPDRRGTSPTILQFPRSGAQVTRTVRSSFGMSSQRAGNSTLREVVAGAGWKPKFLTTASSEL